MLLWKTPESFSISGPMQFDVSVIGICLAKDPVGFIRASGKINFDDREFREVQDGMYEMLALLLRTVRRFVAHLKVIRSVSRELEAKITVSMKNKHLLQMFSIGISK